MHTENPPSPGKAHRHFVALPLLAAFLTLVFFLSMKTGAFRASLLQEDQSLSAPLSVDVGSGFSLPLGVVGQAGDRGAVIGAGDLAELQDGDVLLSSRGIERISVGSGEVVGLSGTIYLSRRDDTLLVAGISGPALLRDAQGGGLLVPAGMQWQGSVQEVFPALSDGVTPWRSARSLKALVPVFLASQMVKAATLAPTDDVLPVSRDTKPDCGGFSFVFLSQSHARVMAQCEEQMFGYLRSLVEAGDADGVHTLLSDPATFSLLNASPLKTWMASVLLTASSKEAMQRDLLRLLQDDEDCWLLASIHPQLRSLQWALPLPPHVSDEAQALRLFAFPQSDTLSLPAPVALRNLWKSSFADVLSQEKTPSIDQEAWALAEEMIALMQNLAYPDRTSQYAGDFFSLLSPLEASASPDHQALLFTLQTLSIGVDDGAFSRSDAIAKTTQALTEAGGTFSVDASLTPYSDHSVRVLGMLFGARIFEFTYDTASAEVSSISEDGKSLPFPMPLEKFSAWAKTEASK